MLKLRIVVTAVAQIELVDVARPGLSLLLLICV